MGLRTERVQISLLPSTDVVEERRKDLTSVALGSLNLASDGIMGNIGIPNGSRERRADDVRADDNPSPRISVRPCERGATIASVIWSFTSLAASANVASAALTRSGGRQRCRNGRDCCGSRCGGLSRGIAVRRSLQSNGLACAGQPLRTHAVGRKPARRLLAPTTPRVEGLRTIARNLAPLHAMRVASSRTWSPTTQVRLTAISLRALGSVGLARLVSTSGSLAFRTMEGQRFRMATLISLSRSVIQHDDMRVE